MSPPWSATCTGSRRPSARSGDSREGWRPRERRTSTRPEKNQGEEQPCLTTTGTEATRSDAPSADESLFGDAAEDTEAAAVEGEDSDELRPHRTRTGFADAAEEQAGQPEDLKVVVSIKGGRATIGVQRPSSDPHIETFDDGDLAGADTGGLGGDRTGESQMGRRAQASGSRETRSPRQASAPACTGVRRRPVGRRGRGRPAATRDAESCSKDRGRKPQSATLSMFEWAVNM